MTLEQTLSSVQEHPNSLHQALQNNFVHNELNIYVTTYVVLHQKPLDACSLDGS